MTQPYQTLADLLIARADTDADATAFRSWSRGLAGDRLSFSELGLAALRSAAMIGEAAPRGASVLLMHPPGLRFIVDFFGCMIAGATAVPVPPPSTPSGERRFDAILAATGARLALTEPGSVATAVRRPRLSVLASATEAGRGAPILDEAFAVRRANSDDLAVIQFTSGSSADPKGAMLTHAAILANLAQIRSALDIRPDLRDEAILLWLPHFHDMGLFGRLQSVFAGCPGNVMSPREFMRRPLSWLEHAAAAGASVTGAPDFAFGLCVEAASAGLPEPLDLSRLRVVFSGAEKVRLPTLRAFAKIFAPTGFEPSSLTPCYGLAEATLMVSAHRPGAPFATRRAPTSAAPLDPGQPDRDVVSCGRPVEGLDVAILDPQTQEEKRNGGIGEIAITGPNLMSGYLGRQPSFEGFAALRRGDTVRRFLRTGDLGFMAGGELHVCGRLRATIIVNGVNLHAQDIEDLVRPAHPLFASARGAAFGVATPAGERPAVIVEVPRRIETAPDLGAAAQALALAVQADCGIAPAFVAVRRRGAIASTTSGKIAYAETVRAFQAGDGGDLARWPSPPGGGMADLSPVEAVVLETIADVLGRIVADPDAEIVSLGGDSTAALRVSSRLAARYGDLFGAGDLGVGDSARTIARKLDMRLSDFLTRLSDEEVAESLLLIAPGATARSESAEGVRV